MIGPTSIGVVDVRMVKLSSPALGVAGCPCCRSRPDTDGHHHIFAHQGRINAAVLPLADELRPPGGGEPGLRDWVEYVLYRSLDGQVVRFTAEVIDDAGYGDA